MKNIKMLVIAVLLVAVAVTSYAVSGTYAKYTTSITKADSARVAKWGIGIENNIDLFKDSYTDVVGKNGNKVVAPGTQGEYTFTLSGAPETAYTLDVVVSGEDNIGQIVYNLDGKEYTTMTELVAAIDALYNPTQVYAAGTSSASTHTIAWYWLYDQNETEDTQDTTLGNAGTATVTLNVKITAVQADTVEVTVPTTTVANQG